LVEYPVPVFERGNSGEADSTENAISSR